MKKRIFYLDFIRAFAVVVILITHFNNTDAKSASGCIITNTVCGLYIGDFGVTLFFIISGAALTYVYQNNLNFKTYFKKRFMNIYPMFYIVFIIATLYAFLINGHILPYIPKKRIIFSILGIDQMMSAFGITTFAIVGEWFLGVILLIYIVFPFILKLFERFPKTTILIIFTVVLISFILVPSKYESVFFVLRLPEIVFGMCFIKYIKQVNIPTVIVSLAVLAVNGFFNVPLNNLLKVYIVGISSFLVLVYISKFLEYQPIKTIIGSISKYSYAIFLVHHFIIGQIFKIVDLPTLTHSENYVLFVLCVIVIAFISVSVYKLNDKTIKYLKLMFVKRCEE